VWNIFSGCSVVLGWILVRVSLETGQSYCLVLALGGFSIIAPFAAAGFYEIWGKLASDDTMSLSEILGLILHQHTPNFPSLSAMLIVIWLFRLLLGHKILCCFLGFPQ